MKDVICFVDVIVGLEQDGVLGVDNGIRYLKVEIRLRACCGHWGRGGGPINAFKFRVRALRNVARCGSVAGRWKGSNYEQTYGARVRKNSSRSV